MVRGPDVEVVEQQALLRPGPADLEALEVFVVLEEGLTERKSETLDALEEGRVFRGVVKNLTDYGAFIDLGGQGTVE